MKPSGHAGKAYELTAGTSDNMDTIAEQFSEVLGRKITYVDVPFDEWKLGLRDDMPEHLFQHIEVMIQLHRAGRYDKVFDGFQAILGRKPSTLRDFVLAHPKEFGLALQDPSSQNP